VKQAQFDKDDLKFSMLSLGSPILGFAHFCCAVSCVGVYEGSVETQDNRERRDFAACEMMSGPTKLSDGL
jgi:hypothetical protein